MAFPPSAEQLFSVPTYYANGFQLGLSNSDINLMLLTNNQPSAGINLSYTTAKTLLSALAEVIGTLERVTERKIMTNDEVAAGLSKLTDSEGAIEGNEPKSAQ